MPTFSYKARDSAGKLVKGAMDVAAAQDVIEKLEKMGYTATKVARALPGVRAETLFDKFRVISADDIIIFNIQLSNMISAGITLATALDSLARQIENKKLRETVSEVLRDVEGGNAFSQALAGHPRVFSRLFVNMVKAGEASGKLDLVLERFAILTEQQQDLKEKIREALFYPIILLCAATAVVLLIVTFVIPRLAQIYTKAGVQLPLPTLFLYSVGMAIKHLWFFILPAVFLGWWFLRRYAALPAGRLAMDKFKLKLPVFGALYRKAAVCRFSRTLGTLVASGVPILESLDIARDVLGNEVLGRVIANVRKSVEKGERISSSMKMSEEFPPDAVQMIYAGEETGNLDGMLDKIADFYEKFLGYSLKKLTAAVEPFFLVVMGTMVTFIMAATLMPIFQIIKVLRR